MRKSLLALLFAAGGLALTSLAQAEVQLKDGHPDRYTVVKGDTLWAVSYTHLDVYKRQEHPSAQPAETLTLFYSGDGGWRDLDRASAEHMAAAGYPVVGIDTLRYYWQHKSPEQSAADLSRLMQQYRDKWQVQRFVLAGYSFGADVLPAIYNRLPASDQQQVDAMLLLALSLIHI